MSQKRLSTWLESNKRKRARTAAFASNPYRPLSRSSRRSVPTTTIRRAILNAGETKLQYGITGSTSGANPGSAVPAGQFLLKDVTALIPYDSGMMSREGYRVRLLSTSWRMHVNNESNSATTSLTARYYARVVCFKLPGGYTSTAGVPDFFSQLFANPDGTAFAHGGTTPNMQQLFYPFNTRNFSVLYDKVFDIPEANNQTNAYLQSFKDHAQLITPAVTLNLNVTYGLQASDTKAVRPTILWCMFVEEDGNSTAYSALRVIGQHRVYFKDT